MTSNEVHRNLDPWHLGWRAKIGLIMPSVEEGQAIYEYRTLLPEGVNTLETRVMCREISPEELKKGRDEVLHAAEMLATAKADVIVYCATAATYVWGVAGDKAIIDEIEKKTGIKATTGASSVMAAFKFLGIKKMLVFSPYNEEVLKMGIKLFEDQGMRVAAYDSMGYTSTHDIYRVPPWEAYQGVMKLYRKNPDVDGIFLSGGGLRTLPIIEILERDTGLPVVGTTPANAWRSLQLVGIKEPINGFGKLMALPR
jgi:maleate isomerase